MPLRAKNDTNSLRNFNLRLDYRLNSYPSDEPVPLDLWYDHPFYGKHDLQQNTILPIYEHLRQVGNKNPVFVLDFVADAFDDLRKYYSASSAKRKINLPSPLLENVVAEKGLMNFGPLYHNNMNILFKVFFDTHKDNKDIICFSSFMREFSNFYPTVINTLPLTRSGFLLSKDCSIRASGLVLEIFDMPPGDDRRKQNFIDDLNFKFYRSVARKYGFKVDKNAPWRLIALLRSKPMGKYMSEYDINSLPQVFEKRFFKLFETDIDVLKKYLVQFYLSFVKAKPIIEYFYYDNSMTAQCHRERKLRAERRVLMTEQQMSRVFREEYWLELYLRARFSEMGKSVSDDFFNAILNQAKNINKILDGHTARAYICNQAKGFPRLVNIDKPTPGYKAPPLEEPELKTVGARSAFSMY